MFWRSMIQRPYSRRQALTVCRTQHQHCTSPCPFAHVSDSVSCAVDAGGVSFRRSCKQAGLQNVRGVFCEFAPQPAAPPPQYQASTPREPRACTSVTRWRRLRIQCAMGSRVARATGVSTAPMIARTLHLPRRLRARTGLGTTARRSIASSQAQASHCRLLHHHAMLHRLPRRLLHLFFERSHRRHSGGAAPAQRLQFRKHAYS